MRAAWTVRRRRPDAARTEPPGDLDAALAAARAADADPARGWPVDRIRDRVALADLLVGAGRPAEARTVLDALPDPRPGRWPWRRRRLGTLPVRHLAVSSLCHTRLGDPSAGLRDADAAVAAWPRTHHADEAEAAAALGEAHLRRGTALEALDRAAEATDALRAAVAGLRPWSTNPGARDLLARSLCGLSASLVARRDDSAAVAEAIRTGREAVAVAGPDPDLLSSALFLTAVALGAAGRDAERLDLLRECVQVRRGLRAGPSDEMLVAALVEQGRSLARLDRPAHALRRYEEAAALLRRSDDARAAAERRRVVAEIARLTAVVARNADGR